LLIAEGAGELGDEYESLVGALETLIRRLLPDVPIDIETDRVSSSRVRGFHGKGGRLFKRAVAWLREAKKCGFAALILVVDRDGEKDRVGQISRAQESDLVQLSRAMGIAIEAFDAWMLADERALTTALGYTVDRQPDPESIADPKESVRALRSQAGLDPSLPELYANIAHQIGLDLLAQRCPGGFAPFAERVRALSPG
jgi:hypothetical protein